MFRQSTMRAVVAGLFACISPLARGEITIDDFRPAPVARADRPCTDTDVSQAIGGAVGVRRTRLMVGELAGNCGVPVVHASAGYRITHRLELIYGQDQAHQKRPMNLDLTEGDQPERVIRIGLHVMDLVEEFVLVVFMNDGSSRSSCAEHLVPNARAFAMEFPLPAFGQDLGVADYADVDYLVLVAQTSSALGAKALSIDSIVAASGHAPGAWIADCR